MRINATFKIYFLNSILKAKKLTFKYHRSMCLTIKSTRQWREEWIKVWKIENGNFVEI